MRTLWLSTLLLHNAAQVVEIARDKFHIDVYDNKGRFIGCLVFCVGWPIALVVRACLDHE